MTRADMWKEFIVAGEWGLKEEFNRLTDEEISRMTPDECILGRQAGAVFARILRALKKRNYKEAQRVLTGGKSE